MSFEPPALGALCRDATGYPWVYIGFRVTAAGTHEHYFVRCLDGKPSVLSNLWTYKASSRETILRRFPSLAVNHE